MGISRLTALIIATNGEQIKCDAGGPDKKGKYMGWITLWKNDRPRELLNTEATYNTADEAIQAVQEAVSAIRKWYEAEYGPISGGE